MAKRYIYYRFNQSYPVIGFAFVMSALEHQVVIELNIKETFPALITPQLAHQFYDQHNYSVWSARAMCAKENKATLTERMKSFEPEDVEAINDLITQLQTLNDEIQQFYLVLDEDDYLDKPQKFMEQMRLMELLNFNIVQYQVLQATRGNLSFLMACELAAVMQTQNTIAQINEEASRNMAHVMNEDQNELMVQFKTLAELNQVLHKQTHQLHKEMQREDIATAVKQINQHPQLRVIK